MVQLPAKFEMISLVYRELAPSRQFTKGNSHIFGKCQVVASEKAKMSIEKT